MTLTKCKRCEKYTTPVPVDEYNKIDNTHYVRTTPKTYVCEYCGWKVKL